LDIEDQMAGSPFKEFEQQAWETVVNDYDAAFSRLTQQVIPSLIKVLRLAPGSRLLDVACGPGYLAAAAAARGATTEGVDFAANMVHRARQLHPQIPFREGDAETLDGYADRSFDAAGMNFGILHFDQPERALSAIFRVLKPGGHFAFTAWAPPEMAMGFAIPLRALQESGNPNVDLPPGPPFFYFSNRDNCAAALARCGYVDLGTEIVPQTWEFNSTAEFFDALLHGTARTGGALKRQTPEQLRAVREHICKAAQAFTSGGKVRLPMPAHLVWARKPL
jgi:ubiquinone/menaquinone biosynthesis C-methylase UbiE